MSSSVLQSVLQCVPVGHAARREPQIVKIAVMQ